MHDLLYTYPISTLQAMSQAGRHNQRAEHMQDVQAMTTAVLHGIDAAWNKGKGKVLKKYIDTIYRIGKTKDVEGVKSSLEGLLSKLGKKHGN